MYNLDEEKDVGGKTSDKDIGLDDVGDEDEEDAESLDDWDLEGDLTE